MIWLQIRGRLRRRAQQKRCWSLFLMQCTNLFKVTYSTAAFKIVSTLRVIIGVSRVLNETGNLNGHLIKPSVFSISSLYTTDTSKRDREPSTPWYPLQHDDDNKQTLWEAETHAATGQSAGSYKCQRVWLTQAHSWLVTYWRSVKALWHRRGLPPLASFIDV